MLRLLSLGLLLAAAAQAQPFVSLYREALERQQKQFGPAHPKVAECLTNLALLLQHSGDSAAAEPLLRQALAIAERVFGPQDARVVPALVNLAGVLEARSLPQASEPLYRRALLLKEKTSARNTPMWRRSHQAGGGAGSRPQTRRRGSPVSARPRDSGTCSRTGASRPHWHTDAHRCSGGGESRL